MAESEIIRLTDAVFNQSAYVRYSSPVDASQGLSITFDFYAYGGTGADGISFFLVNGQQEINRPGASGAALGYAALNVNGSIVPGVAGGYLGIGFDEFGNYSSPMQLNGGPGSSADSVAVRGSEATKYLYLGGNSLPSSLDNISPGATQANSKRTAKVDLSPTGLLSVRVDLNADGDFTDLGEVPIDGLNVVASNGPLPATFKFGFAASTGGSTNIHEVGNFSVKTFAGAALAGDFTADLVITNPSNSTTNDKPVGGSGNDTISTGGGNDTIIGNAGNDILVGGLGADTITGGVGGDRFYFQAGSKREALRQSTLKSHDEITDFAFSRNPLERDLLGLDFDNNLATIEKPQGKFIYNAGKKRGNLLKAAQSAYADKNFKQRGNQKLKGDEAVFFKLGSRSFVSVNDNKAPFSAQNDLLVELPGMQLKPGDLKKGTFALSDYFVV